MIKQQLWYSRAYEDINVWWKIVIIQVIRGESGGNPMAKGGPVCIFMSPKFLLKIV